MVTGDSQQERILAEVAVDEASGFAGKALSEVLSGARDVVVLAVRNADGEIKVGPPASTRLQPGDRITVVGDEDELRSIGAMAQARGGR
jgi:Trk K+ transport system NAD-binding subunit